MAGVLDATCPRCHAQLDYEEDGYRLSHIVGVEIRGVYDGVLFWQCPFCNGRWHRWKPGTRQHARAEEYVSA